LEESLSGSPMSGKALAAGISGKARRFFRNWQPAASAVPLSLLPGQPNGEETYQRMTATSIIWEIPLAIASRFLFLCTRFVLRRIARLHFRLAKKDASRWQVLGEDLFRHSLALPVIMTEGPRWNTHAVIGRVGPLSVRQSLAVQTSLADASAQAWTIVVYSFPDHRTVATLRPESPAAGDGWTSTPLSEGRYCLILRYYQPSPAARLPAVAVDGEPHVSSLSVPDHTNDFYQRLRGRRRGFYTWLHYHAYVALRYRHWLPRKSVERMYLPVGNPETQFQYGALAESEHMQISIAQGCLDAFDVYITIYDLASFPLVWKRLEVERSELGPFSQRCTFLIRFHPKTADAPAVTDHDVQVTFRTAPHASLCCK
jgi:hypothetical protein